MRSEGRGPYGEQKGRKEGRMKEETVGEDDRGERKDGKD